MYVITKLELNFKKTCQPHVDLFAVTSVFPSLCHFETIIKGFSQLLATNSFFNVFNEAIHYSFCNKMPLVSKVDE
jgi:hypothetical protein